MDDINIEGWNDLSLFGKTVAAILVLVILGLGAVAGYFLCVGAFHLIVWLLPFILWLNVISLCVTIISMLIKTVLLGSALSTIGICTIPLFKKGKGKANLQNDSSNKVPNLVLDAQFEKA